MASFPETASLPTMLATLLSLPTELLFEIADYLPPDTFLGLSTLNRRLQDIFLPLFFRAHNYDLPQIGPYGGSEYRLSGKDMTLLPALQVSLTTESLKGLTCTLSPGSYAVLREISTLRRLVSRLKRLGYLKLNLVALNFHDTPHDKRGVILRAWATTFVELLNVVISRGDIVLTVVYGNKSLASKKYFRLSKEDPPPVVEIPKPKPSTSNRRGLIPKLIHGLHLSSSKGRVSPTADDHYQPPPLSPQNEEITFQLPVSTRIALEIFDLHSPLLLRPPFLDWLSRTLNAGSASLKTLSLDNLTLSNPSPIDGEKIKERLEATFLPSLFLPNLTKLSLGNCEVIWEDLVAFLSRHTPSLITLDLYRNTFRRSPTMMEMTKVPVMFERLKSITATPEYLVAFLAPVSVDLQTFRRQYPALETIVLTSDYYGMPPYGYQYGRFNEVFRLLATLSSSSREACLELELRFLGGIGLEAWLSLSSMTEYSLSIVHTLSLSTDHRFFFTFSLMKSLIPFVSNMFRNVRRVKFWARVVLSDTGEGEDSEQKVLEILRSRGCQDLQTVKVDVSS